MGKNIHTVGGHTQMRPTQTELKKILADIREKTGADARLVSRGGEETRFLFTYRGRQTEAWIDGTGEAAQREAKLIAYLVETADSRTLIPAKADALRTILLGEGGGWYAFRFMTKFNLADGPCVALDIVPDKHLSEVYAQLERTLSDSQDMAVCMDDHRIAVVHFSDGDQSDFEFGEFMHGSLYEELGVRVSVGVGCDVSSFSEIAQSYLQAVTAVRVSGIFHNVGEVHSYREYLLVKLLEDLPKSRIQEYLEQFRAESAKEVFEDEEMMETAETFLESSLNVSETSRKLFMHRNTLMYRMDKIERVTGLNIRKFSDAVTFRILSVLYKLQQT